MSDNNIIEPNDIILINNKDIVSEIDGTFNGICAIASYGLVRQISSDVSNDFFKLDRYNDILGSNSFSSLQVFNGGIYVGNSSSICIDMADKMLVGGQTLCTVISSQIDTSANAAVNSLSTRLSDDFQFEYDLDSNMISAHVAGKTLAFSADKFTEARMISSVGVEYHDDKPYMKIFFKTESGIQPVEFALEEVMSLYYGENGIDIQYVTTDGNPQYGKYVVSADGTICRRNDISAISTDNTILTGKILTSLSQRDGKISYSTSDILSSYVIGLSDYISASISDLQEKLVFDALPTNGSPNVVSSGGIWSAIQDASPENYADVSAQVYQNKSDISTISSDVAKKSSVSVDNVQSDLNVVHMSYDEYAHVLTGDVPADTLYILSGETIEAYGKKIVNVLSGNNATDAATYGQIADVKRIIDSLSTYSEISTQLSNDGYALTSQTSSATDLDTKFKSLSTYSDISTQLSNNGYVMSSQISSKLEQIDHKILIDDRIDDVSAYGDLNVVKLSVNEYATILSDGADLSNGLYVVENDVIDVYGQQIKNVAYPTDLSDATPKMYVDNIVNLLKDALSVSEISSKTSADDIQLSNVTCCLFYLNSAIASLA